MTGVLFAAGKKRWRRWEAPLRAAFAQIGTPVTLSPDMPASDVRFIIYAPDAELTDFGAFPNLEAVLGIWAGVEDIVGNPTLTAPLARMVDPGLTAGMVEYVCGHVLRHHLGIDAQLARQDGTWDDTPPPLAANRRVSVLGLGALGGAAARALADLGFDVAGWSRTPKAMDGIPCHAGDAGLAAVLARSEILVLLLPLTGATRHIIDARAMARLPDGAIVVNPGRGPLIDDTALLDALDAGRIAHATLDVFATEPLPPGHVFWAHPRVTVTPHIASATRPETAARVIAENVRRGAAGEPLLHLVDRSAGY